MAACLPRAGYETRSEPAANKVFRSRLVRLHLGTAPREATREAFAAAIEQWPDIRFERKRVHIGPGHFVSEYRMSAGKDGQPIACDGVDVFTVQGGQVARKDTYLDWVAVQEQLAHTAAASV